MSPFFRATNLTSPSHLHFQSRLLQQTRSAHFIGQFTRFPAPRRYYSHLYPRYHLQVRTSGPTSLSVLVVAVALSIGAGYFATARSSGTETTRFDLEKPVEFTASATIFEDSYNALLMAAAIPAGRPGTLTSEQEAKLKEFWLATLDVFGVTPKPASNPNTPPIGSESPELTKKKKSRVSWIGRHRDKGSEKSGDGDEDDKFGQTKEFKQALASQSAESLRLAFWSMVKHDDPDALLLRFLRARKWDVHNALVMMVSTMHWRSQEMHVDDEIMFKGETGFNNTAKTATGTEKKDAEGFMEQLRVGKSFLHGTDKDGRPITIVRARTHHPGENTEKSLEQYTVYVIETTRMLLRPPVDTATIVFDMTGFSMSNMDYTPVKFMIKCFEANYPESLGSVLVYKAPWIFQGIWKIIKGWLDPVVASKVHFADDEKELSQHIHSGKIIKELGGQEVWSYSFIEPAEGEDAQLADTATRERIEAERKSIVETYEKETLAWAKGENKGEKRTELAKWLRDNYWTLDPYVRARSLYDRIGVLGPAGKLEFYPCAKPACVDGTTAAQSTSEAID